MAESRSQAKAVSQILIYVVLAVIALVSVVLLITIWRSGAQVNTLAYEIAKACIQVLSVALAGFVISFATFTLQYNRERREQQSDQARERLQREVERKREESQREVERKRQDWQREVEQTRDARQRKDELLQSTLSKALSAYHTAKGVRRILRARIWARADGSRVDPDVYDQQMALINDVQLQFEELKRIAPLCDETRVDTNKLEQSFEKIEVYLGVLIAEYESKRRGAAHTQGSISTADMPRLAEFLHREDKRSFIVGIAGPVHGVFNDLRRALLKPLELPAPTAAE